MKGGGRKGRGRETDRPPAAPRASGEDAFIARWCAPFDVTGEGVLVPVGDDAAVVANRPGTSTVATTDALVDGVHFHRDWLGPRDLGQRILTVNLSDLAAMGATPRHLLVALTVPGDIAAGWLSRVATGMADLARAEGVTLIGGNVSRGPVLSFTLTLLGEVSPGRVVTRSGAGEGDAIWVTGTLGDAALGLERLLAAGDRRPSRGGLETAWRTPTARVAFGKEMAAAGVTAAMDLSDGLSIDLPRLCRSSEVGAEIRLEALPRSPAADRALDGRPDPWTPMVSGGEDYELVFTAPPAAADSLHALGQRTRTPVTCIGEVVAGARVRYRRPDGTRWTPSHLGWDHLGTPPRS